jgi:hypothetical protein
MPQKLLDRTPILVALIAAVTTLAVALGGVINGSISAYYQRKTDEENLRNQLLISVMGNPAVLHQKDYAKALIAAGVLVDTEGAICRAFVGGDCPIKVLR